MRAGMVPATYQPYAALSGRAFAGRQVRAGTEAVVFRLAEVITILELMLPQNDDGVRPVVA